MEEPFKQETTAFLNDYYEAIGITSEEMKKTLNIEKATDEELLAQFSEEEIQMGIDEYDELFELIYSLLYFKSINDNKQYFLKLELLKEFNNESFSKTILKKYLNFEKTIFIK
jgi:hypothetical protein